jgi:hypothetical protein
MRTLILHYDALSTTGGLSSVHSYSSLRSFFGYNIDSNHQQVRTISLSSDLYIPTPAQVSQMFLKQSRQTYFFIPSIHYGYQSNMAWSSDVPTLILDHLIYAIIVAVVIQILLSRQRQQIIAGLPQIRHEERCEQDVEGPHLKRRRSPLRTSLSKEELRAQPSAEQRRQQAQKRPTDGPQVAAPRRPRRRPHSTEQVIDLLVRSGRLNGNNEDGSPIFDSSDDSYSSRYSFPRFEPEHFSSALYGQNPPTVNLPGLAPAPPQNASPFYPAQPSGTVSNLSPPNANTTSLNLRGGGERRRRRVNKKVNLPTKEWQRYKRMQEIFQEGSRMTQSMYPTARDLNARLAEPQSHIRTSTRTRPHFQTQTPPPQDDSYARSLRRSHHPSGAGPWMPDWRLSQIPLQPQPDLQATAVVVGDGYEVNVRITPEHFREIVGQPVQTDSNRVAPLNPNQSL